MRVHLQLEIEVTDERTLRDYAMKRYRELWKEPPPLETKDLVFEALIGSNEGPSPDLLGLEIHDWKATKG